MFFVDELMNNDRKFDIVIQKANLASKFKSSSEHEDKSNKVSLKFEL